MRTERVFFLFASPLPGQELAQSQRERWASLAHSGSPNIWTTYSLSEILTARDNLGEGRGSEGWGARIDSSGS